MGYGSQRGTEVIGYFDKGLSEDFGKSCVILKCVSVGG